MVPTSIAAANMPRSRSATARSGISVRKAATVVMFPIIRGDSTSCRLVRVSAV